MPRNRWSHRSGPAILGTLLLLALPAAPPLAGQQPAAPQPAVPAARPADVASIDAIIGALYDVISGPAGQARDWDRFRSLFAPGARLIPTGRRPDGTGALRTMDVEEYATVVGPQLELGGFFEREIGRQESRYGNIVQLMSAYDSRRTLADPAPFARGVNSIQLWNDGRRWWVVTIHWEAESPATPIPDAYLRRP